MEMIIAFISPGTSTLLCTLWKPEWPSFEEGWLPEESLDSQQSGQSRMMGTTFLVIPISSLMPMTGNPYPSSFLPMAENVCPFFLGVRVLLVRPLPPEKLEVLQVLLVLQLDQWEIREV